MEAKKGDKVKVQYTVKESSGEVIESSDEALPIEFTIGEGHVIPGLESGIIGMKVNDTKTIDVPCDGGCQRLVCTHWPAGMALVRMKSPMMACASATVRALIT